MDREAETGEAVRRLARRGDGSASPRRGRGSALARGIQRDGQFPRCGRHSPENVEFWAGSRKDDGAACCRDRPCPESAARSWLPSPTPRPTTGRFSGSSGPTSRRSISFMHISAKLPSMRWRPTGTTNTASLCATHGVDKVGDTPSPRQSDDENGDRSS